MLDDLHDDPFRPPGGFELPVATREARRRTAAQLRGVATGAFHGAIATWLLGLAAPAARESESGIVLLEAGRAPLMILVIGLVASRVWVLKPLPDWALALGVTAVFLLSPLAGLAFLLLVVLAFRRSDARAILRDGYGEEPPRRALPPALGTAVVLPAAGVVQTLLLA